MRPSAPAGTGTLTKDTEYLETSQPQLDFTFSDALSGFATLPAGVLSMITSCASTQYTSYPWMSIWLISPWTMFGPNVRVNVT